MLADSKLEEGERMNRKLSLILFVTFAVSGAAFGQQPKVYIQPQGGFESYISAGLVKKQVPVAIVENKDTADYVLTSGVLSHEESTGSKVARCLFAYCAGIGGTQTATVQLIDVKTQAVVWSYNVRKAGSGNYQSSAEAIAKHLKQYLGKQGALNVGPGKFTGKSGSETFASSSVSPAPAQPPAQAGATELSAAVIKSTPDGGEITVDGKFLGSTPSTVRLAPGDHTITVEKSGFKSWQRTMTVSPGGSVTIDATLDKTP